MQIAVVGEGVDLPIRRVVDLHPMISPVEWLQLFGRNTRPTKPGEPPPEYLCCNRNLLRHAYLLEGCLPPTVFTEGTAAFGGPSARQGMRAVGLETLGRFKGAEIAYADGTQGVCYSVSTCVDNQMHQYTCILHPLREEPIWAHRVNQRTDDPMRPHYGRWERCPTPDDLSGFASVSPAPITDKMKSWWNRSAKSRGLDPSAKVTRKNFQVLAVLSDLKTRI